MANLIRKSLLMASLCIGCAEQAVLGGSSPTPLHQSLDTGDPRTADQGVEGVERSPFSADPIAVLTFTDAGLDPTSGVFRFRPILLEPLNGEVMVTIEVFGAEGTFREVFQLSTSADGTSSVDVKSLLPSASPAQVRFSPFLWVDGIKYHATDKYAIVFTPGPPAENTAIGDFAPSTPDIADSVEVAVRVGPPANSADEADDLASGGDL